MERGREEVGRERVLGKRGRVVGVDGNGERGREKSARARARERERQKPFGLAPHHHLLTPTPLSLSLSLSCPPLLPQGHCVDIDRDECTAIEVDQYDRDIAALVVRRDAGEIPAGELRLLPPLPPPVAQAAEEVAAPAQP